MYFISDLDKTLIYSKNQGDVIVEYKDSTPITSMTEEAVQTMNRLLCDKTFNFIPCTLRSLEQTMRVNFIKSRLPEYMICDNGGSIYHNGKLDREWDKKLNKIVNRDMNVWLYNKLNTYIKDNNIPIYMLKSNRNLFMSVIFNTNEIASQYIDGILELVDKEHYKVFKQGKKTYIVPTRLNKEIAVQYLKDCCKVENIITAGDSNVDDKFVQLGDYQILPEHAVFRTEKAIVTKTTGVLGGEEILKIVEKLHTTK